MYCGIHCHDIIIVIQFFKLPTELCSHAIFNNQTKKTAGSSWEQGHHGLVMCLPSLCCAGDKEYGFLPRSLHSSGAGCQKHSGMYLCMETCYMYTCTYMYVHVVCNSIQGMGL